MGSNNFYLRPTQGRPKADPDRPRPTMADPGRLGISQGSLDLVLFGQKVHQVKIRVSQNVMFLQNGGTFESAVKLKSSLVGKVRTTKVCRTAHTRHAAYGWYGKIHLAEKSTRNF